MATYDGCLPKNGLCGYAFHVLVTGLRKGGWEPDPGAFFLEHPPHLGAWPVHYSKQAIWQLLLSVALGPAFCVCRASYVTVSYSPPFHSCALPSSWLPAGDAIDTQEDRYRSQGLDLVDTPCADEDSSGSFLSSLDVEV